jgi:hypothetical protein
VEPDPAQIGRFVDVVFGHCEGLIPVRGFVAKGQGKMAAPLDRLKREAKRLWELHIKRHGPPLIRLDSAAPAQAALPTFSLGALLDDRSPMPDDIIGPRVLTPGGLLVLGGAP